MRLKLVKAISGGIFQEYYQNNVDEFPGIFHLENMAFLRGRERGRKLR